MTNNKRSFGSRAHGDHEERSDIDLAIVAPNLSKRDWYLLIDTFEEELQTFLKLDVVRWESAPEKLKNEILKCNVPLL